MVKVPRYYHVVKSRGGGGGGGRRGVQAGSWSIFFDVGGHHPFDRSCLEIILHFWGETHRVKWCKTVETESLDREKA